MISRRSTFKAALLAATAASFGSAAWAADKTLKVGIDLSFTGADAAKGNAKVRELLFYDLLAAGIYSMPKRGFMALSLPLTGADFDALEAALDEFVSARASLLA